MPVHLPKSRQLRLQALISPLMVGIPIVAQPAFAQSVSTPEIDDAIEQNQARIEEERRAQRREPAQSDLRDGYRGGSLKSAFENDTIKFPVDRIVISGANTIPKSTIEAIKRAYLKAPMGRSEVDNLLRDIRQAYYRAGFGLVQINIGEQSLAQGELRLIVLEGNLENLLICKNGKERKGANTAFRVPKGSLFQVRPYEQGLDTIDGLFSYRKIQSEYVNDPELKGCEHVRTKRVDERSNASGDALVAPGSDVGLSEVIVSTSQPRPFWVSGGVDNLGSTTTGKTRLNALLALEDVLGLYEQVTVRGSHTTNFKNSADRARNIGANISVPLGYWSFGLNGSYYDYRTTGSTANQPFVTDGRQTYFGANVGRVISRGPEGVWSAGIALEVKDSDNFVNAIRLNSSSRRLSIATASLTHRGPFLKGNLYSSLSVSRGIGAFGALRDGPIVKIQPHAQFTNVALNLDFQRSFYARKPSLDPETGAAPYPDFAIRSSWSASWSPNALYGSEKIQIGGPFTVRGFDDANLSGDVGGFVRNELTWFPRMSNKSAFLKKAGRPAVFAGIDAGYIARDYADRSQEKGLVGAVLGARLVSRNLTAEARVETPLAHPVLLQRGKTIFRFQVSVRL